MLFLFVAMEGLGFLDALNSAPVPGIKIKKKKKVLSPTAAKVWALNSGVGGKGVRLTLRKWSGKAGAGLRCHLGWTGVAERDLCLWEIFFFHNSQAHLKGKQAQNQAQPNLLPQSLHRLLRPWTQIVQGPPSPLWKSQRSWIQVSLE